MPATRPFDLSPARWVWLDVRRTLPGTFALFRRIFDLAEIPAEAGGWIVADSRYRLSVNGRRVQWGPAPSDPRHLEADPVDLKPHLRRGRNVVGIQAVLYGAGRPGLLAHLRAGDLTLHSGPEWEAQPDRARTPDPSSPQPSRPLWEEYDSRLFPHGWDDPERAERAGAGTWMRAHVLDLSPAKTPFSGGHSNDAEDFYAPASTLTDLRPRSIPLMREEIVRATHLVDRGRVAWRRSPDDWFDDRLAGSLAVERHDDRRVSLERENRVRLVEDGPQFLTFELPYGMVGWPQITIDAPKGTVVEVVSQESRDPADPWLDSHFYTWSRFVSRGVEETFEPFEYEGLRYLMLHFRDGRSGTTVRNVGVRRRESAFPMAPVLKCDDPALQTLFDATLRTVVNSAGDAVVDGMGRERQQRPGDGSHQLGPVRTFFGGIATSRRFLETFATGQLGSGVWLDSWPAYDRLARLGQRELGATEWGPLVDHSVGFVLDHVDHAEHTGDLAIVQAHWPRIERFLAYLRAKMAPDGLFPVEGLGIEAVWMDHDAFRSQGEKRCAMNLYVAHMLERAATVAPDPAPLRAWREGLEATLRRAYYRDALGAYVANAEGYDGGEAPRFDDRSLSHHLLGVLPGRAPEALRLLAEMPPNVGRSTPANAVWRVRALARHGLVAPILADLRERWATMLSVRENGTVQEMWTVRPGTSALMSHCAVAPLVAAHEALLGLRPTSPGYATYALRPNLGDLGRFETVAATPTGALRFRAEREEPGGAWRYEIVSPRYGAGSLVLKDRTVALIAGTRETFRELAGGGGDRGDR